MAVIVNDAERDAALKELERLWSFLHEVETRSPKHGSTKAGIHKMMARIHEELMRYEARRDFPVPQANGKAHSEQHVEATVDTAAISE